MTHDDTPLLTTERVTVRLCDTKDTLVDAVQNGQHATPSEAIRYAIQQTYGQGGEQA